MIASADPAGGKMLLLFQRAPETLLVETAYDGISLGVVTLAPTYAPFFVRSRPPNESTRVEGVGDWDDYTIIGLMAWTPIPPG